MTSDFEVREADLGLKMSFLNAAPWFLSYTIICGYVAILQSVTTTLLYFHLSVYFAFLYTTITTITVLNSFHPTV